MMVWLGGFVKMERKLKIELKQDNIAAGATRLNFSCIGVLREIQVANRNHNVGAVVRLLPIAQDLADGFDEYVSREGLNERIYTSRGIRGLIKFYEEFGCAS